MDRFCLLEGPNSPWGDYGAILANGMCAYSADGGIRVRRTGPFVPPISFPGASGAMIVTDQFKTELCASELSGLTFFPVVKEHIVQSNWETWDTHAPDPAEYPDGEPEDYIDNKCHSPEAASQMGPIWEARSERVVECITSASSFDDPPEVTITTNLVVFAHLDFFRTQHRSGMIFVSEKAKQWLANKVSKWVQFRRVRLAN